MKRLNIHKKLKRWKRKGDDDLEHKFAWFLKKANVPETSPQEDHLAQQLRQFFFSMKIGDYVLLRDCKGRREFIVGKITSDVMWHKVSETEVLGVADVCPSFSSYGLLLVAV
jgi:hypothetical protein